jgi:hypothetical protein
MENFSDMIVKLIKNINPITDFIKKHESHMIEQNFIDLIQMIHDKKLIQVLNLFSSILDDVDVIDDLQHLKNIEELDKLNICLFNQSEILQNIKNQFQQYENEQKVTQALIEQIITNEQYILNLINKWKYEHVIMNRLYQNINDRKTILTFDENSSRQEIYQAIFGKQ